MMLPFSISDIKKVVDPETMKTVWMGVIHTPDGEAIPFEKVSGGKPTVSAAAKAAGLKLTVSFVEDRKIVTREIDLREAQKLKTGAIIKYNGRVLVCKTGSK